MNDNGSVRVPKGILKNRSSASSYESTSLNPSASNSYGQSTFINPSSYISPPSGVAGQAMPRYHHPPPPPQLFGTAYGAQLVQPVHPAHGVPNAYHPGGMESSSSASSRWGMNYEPPAPPEPMLSEEQKFRKKLDDFLSEKGSLVFRKLDPEEKPLLESRLEEQKSEGSYGITPSIDYYLPLDTTERVNEFFKMVQVGDIVVGEVHSTSSSGLVFRLLCCDGGNRSYLEDLSIKALCPMNQVVAFNDPNDPERNYEEDDKARLEILDINYDSRKITLGMKGLKISTDLRHAFPLGPILSSSDLPPQYVLTKAENKSRRRKSYEQLLEYSSGFHNPNSTVCLGTSLGVFSSKNSLCLGLRGKFSPKDMANELRAAQNSKWAQHNVTIGIRHFKQGNQVEAFQCLNKAIIIDPQNVEGLVARGALYANNGSFERAMEDFEAALKSNSEHFNGRKYMAETLVVVAKSQLEASKIDEALTSFVKCLSVLPEHKESILTLMSIHEHTEKMDVSRLTGSTASKLVDLKEKLRLMITQEIAKKKIGYYEKGDHKPLVKPKVKQESSDSDSSSSDSSDSSSDSSFDGSERKDKRKKKKKHKKRSKKSKKRELSLSPFSKKLAGQEASASVSTGRSGYTEWSQQVGINQFAGGSDSESQRSSRKSRESKKSKKKEKRKKKKGGSSSSDSDSYSRNKKKSKRDQAKVITDFGEIEEQLTAFFSKCEQGGPKTQKIPPQSVKVTVEQAVDKRYVDPYDSSVRRIEVVPDEFRRGDRRTYDYHGNPAASAPQPPPRESYSDFLQTQTIVRTVQNDQSENKRFESRFSGKAAAPPPPVISKSAVSNVSPNNASGASSKWRSIGSAPAEPAPAISALALIAESKSRSKYVEAVPQKVAGPTAATIASKSTSRDPPKSGTTSASKSERERDNDRQNRIRRKSRSRSLSKTRRKSSSRSKSRSKSRSPRARGRRGRRSPSPRLIRRSRSRSRKRKSRSRSRGRRRSFSRSRSRSAERRNRRGNTGNSPIRARDGGDSREPVRFFQGIHPAMSKAATTARPPPAQANSSGSRGAEGSRFRSRHRSRSGSSRSRSKSPRQRNERQSSKKTSSPYPQTDAAEAKGTAPVSSRRKDSSKYAECGEASVKGKSEGSLLKHDKTEIHVLGLTTRRIADVEQLLDRHKAHKKEEIREMNPEFFRNP